MYERLYQALLSLGIETLREEPLAKHTTFRVGGPARLFCRPVSVTEVEALVRLCREADAPLYVLGNGSNLLVADSGVDGVVLHTAGLDGLTRDGDGFVCGAGVQLSALCLEAQRASLAGLAFAYGIPGTVGGAVLMNAGAYGGEMCQVLTEATVLLDGRVRTFSLSEMELSYRHSVFLDNGAVILSARVSLSPGDPEVILTEMRELLSRRKEKQPLEYPSAGSTFKRPVGAYAAALIDRCGLKGHRCGGAMVSDKHAGFVVNAGWTEGSPASCADVLAVMEQVRQAVLEQTGFVLEPEVRIWGM